MVGDVRADGEVDAVLPVLLAIGAVGNAGARALQASVRTMAYER